LSVSIAAKSQPEARREDGLEIKLHRAEYTVRELPRTAGALRIVPVGRILHGHFQPVHHPLASGDKKSVLRTPNNQPVNVELLTFDSCSADDRLNALGLLTENLLKLFRSRTRRFDPHASKATYDVWFLSDGYDLRRY
jgi:hypothetical protein